MEWKDFDLLKLAATISCCQVIDAICPQLSELFVADTLNDVDSHTMQLFMNVVNVATSDVNPLCHTSTVIYILLALTALTVKGG